MPDQKSVTTPRDIANKAETTVVSLPQRATSLLLCYALCAMSEESCGKRDKERASEQEYLRQALRFLKDEFQQSFRAADGDLSDDLKAALRTLREAVDTVCQKLPADQSDASSGLLEDLKADVEDSLAPAVTSFLSALFDSVVAWEKASARLAKDVDSSALSQIDTISRKINFIAVNASVEAARVGDVGKGFAVIASEIKELSQQSRVAVEQMRSTVS